MTKRQPKAFARIGDVRFVLNGTTVVAQQRCGSVTLGDHSERHYWHFAGRVGLEALMVAARHGIQTRFKGSWCGSRHAKAAEGDPLAAWGHHEFWLSADDAKMLLVRVDERQQVTP